MEFLKIVYESIIYGIFFRLPFKNVLHEIDSEKFYPTGFLKLLNYFRIKSTKKLLAKHNEFGFYGTRFIHLQSPIFFKKQIINRIYIKKSSISIIKSFNYAHGNTFFEKYIIHYSENNKSKKLIIKNNDISKDLNFLQSIDTNNF